jgi:hypothetical protein
MRILIEWIGYDKDDEDPRLNHHFRVDDLARMIDSASDRHPDLHTVDCLGYVNDTATCRYCFIFEAH